VSQFQVRAERWHFTQVGLHTPWHTDVFPKKEKKKFDDRSEPSDSEAWLGKHQVPPLLTLEGIELIVIAILNLELFWEAHPEISAYPQPWYYFRPAATISGNTYNIRIFLTTLASESASLSGFGPETSSMLYAPFDVNDFCQLTEVSSAHETHKVRGRVRNVCEHAGLAPMFASRLISII